jgi:hypothetical protein
MVMTRSSRISTAVFSSMPMPSRLGEFATSDISRP